MYLLDIDASIRAIDASTGLPYASIRAIHASTGLSHASIRAIQASIGLFYPWGKGDEPWGSETVSPGRGDSWDLESSLIDQGRLY